MPLTLFHADLSPPSRTVLLVIRTLGLEVTIKHLDLFKKEHLSEEFLKINPQHTVPTLVDNGFVVVDSHAISIYLAEVYGKNEAFYPKDPKKRAIIHQRLYFDAGILFERMKAVVYPVFFNGEKTIAEDKKKALHEALDWQDGFLADTEYLAGDTLTLADVVSVAEVSTIHACGFDFNRHPRLLKWLKRMEKEIPGYECNVPGITIYAEMLKRLMDGANVE